VDAVAGLWESRHERPEQDGLAGAGRRDQRGGHPILDRPCEVAQRLGGGRDVEAIVGADLAGEGDCVTAEVVAQVGGGFCARGALVLSLLG
jgi:hypothetical protein